MESGVLCKMHIPVMNQLFHAHGCAVSLPDRLNVAFMSVLPEPASASKVCDYAHLRRLIHAELPQKNEF